MKKVLILGASILQLPAIKKAKQLGHYVICIDYNSNSIGFEYCDKYYVESTLNYEQVLFIAKSEKVNGIFTIASDRPLPIIAKVCYQLNLPGITELSASYVTNKFLMREQFKKNNVPSPKFFLVENKKQIKSYLKQLNVPLVIKPINNSGSRGVNLLNPNDDDKTTNEFINDTLKNSNDSKMILEEYMYGPEYSVEGISVNGEYELIAITEKITTGPPFFVEIGHSQPAILAQDIILEIENLIKKACKSLLIENSVSHAEVIITSDGPRIVEIGSRLGGDNIASHLVPLSTGVNMIELVINQSLGLKVEFSKTKNRASGIRYFESYNGILKNIENTNQINKIENVKELVLTKNIGDTLTDIIDSNSRIGYVIAEHENRLELDNLLNKIVKKINISIES